MQAKSISLFFKEGASDKEYHAQLEAKNGGWVVNFQYGCRGSALRADTKTPQSLSYDEAEDIYLKLIREKMAKGYRPVLETTPGPTGTKSQNAKAQACELLTPIEFDQVAKYILDPNYWMQDKRDGHRRMVRKNENGIVGINRRGLTVPLPVRLYIELGDLGLNTFLLDGEIEGEMLIVFDVLDADGDLTSMPYGQRFERLLEAVKPPRLKSGTELFYIVPVPTWRTREEKEEGLRVLYSAKAEGIVFKRVDAPYAAGRAGSHLKFKFTATCTARVRQLNKKRSVALEALDDNGTWIEIGNVSISVPHDIPTVGSLVEVRYLYATSGRQLYQPVYLGPREDICEADCTASQLKFKQEDDEAL